MKIRKGYTKYLFASAMLAVGGGLSSCEDFLTILPTDQTPEEYFWQEKSDLEAVRAGAYQLLASSSLTEKMLLWGEVRSDNLQLNDMSQSNLEYLQNAVLQPNLSMFDWSDFYKGINYCNLILEKGEEMTEPGKEVDPSFTRSDWNIIQSEVLSLRALYYFELVRAYRNVPFVTTAIRTDKEATAAKPSATSGTAILGELISELESTVSVGAENYGSSSDNKGRFTKWSTHALLADMYIWRGCLLQNFLQKPDHGNVNLTDITQEDGSLTDASGAAINSSYCTTLANQCFQKAQEHCQAVIDRMKKEYKEKIDKNPLSYTDSAKTQPYPLYLVDVIDPSAPSISASDVPYAKNFGTQNSDESVLELQYNGTNTTNSIINSYLSSYSSSSLTAKYFTLNSSMYSSATSVNPDMGYGKTDMRLYETIHYNSVESTKPIIKFLARSISFDNLKDLSKNTNNRSMTDIYTDIRSNSNNDAHWPVYRLSDVLLMKAEAIARSKTTDAETLREGFRCVNQIFKRNNPALVGPNDLNAATVTDNELKVDRCGYDYGMSGGTFSKTASDLLPLVYHERQREFVGEGKRWFDLVRQMEYVYQSGTAAMTSISSYVSVKTNVRTRMTNLYSFYNPIYSEELKVNKNLTQNPVWLRYTKK